MKHRFAALGIIFVLAVALPVAARADGVGRELERRGDLSDFYQALVSTGVIREINPDAPYTIFAPTNTAFRHFMHEYAGDACIRDEPCRLQLAAILRNHIVLNKVYLDDTVAHQGGLFSMTRRFIPVGEPSKGLYAVDGQPVVETEMIGGGALYTINGVIANGRELSALEGMREAAEPMVQEATTTTERTIPDPRCGPAGCPEARTTTTTITRTITDVQPVP